MSETVIEEAARLTTQDRQDIYGHPADDFAKVAQMTRPIMESDIHPVLQHSLYMVQVKIARLLNTPTHRDSIVDGIGYFNTYAMALEKLKDGIK